MHPDASVGISLEVPRFPYLFVVGGVVEAMGSLRGELPSLGRNGGLVCTYGTGVSRVPTKLTL